MTTYDPPLEEISFVVNEVMGLAQLAELPAYAECGADLVGAIYAEAAKYFAGRIGPSNYEADREGSQVVDGRVHPAPSLDGLYRSYVEGGWPALTGNPEFGGQGIPHLVGAGAEEMCQSANLSFSLLPLLTNGVITAIEKYGSDQQKNVYLPKLISGEWTGTMNLTESQAGSDLAAIRCRAQAEGDHYLISGQKIFITWGDHPYADNIVHLVLARTPDAPAGVKGISLFIVPKFILDTDGQLGHRNDVYPVSVEEKLGIHASPTCVMAFGDNSGGAIGYLVGEENQGLVYMFAMMNHARLAVGLQGVGVAERAYQKARTYAREREQGSVPGNPGRAAIIHHPDVRRMLMDMKSLTEGARALAYSAFKHWDWQAHHSDLEARDYHQRRVDLLTPLVKTWCTEAGNRVAYVGVQIHGGMGFVEETGAAQYMRDARILPIYEGTNGIQAMDLVGRKLLRDRGEAFFELLGDLRQLIAPAAGSKLNESFEKVESVLKDCEVAVTSLLDKAPVDQSFGGAVGADLLMLLANSTAGALMLQSALRAQDLLGQGADNSTYSRRYLEAKITTARYFVHAILPECTSFFEKVRQGSGYTMALPEDAF